MLASPTLRILVAEDDFLVGEEIVRVLRHLGHTDVTIASTGLAAVELTCSLRPDVVLMDVRMPGLDGLEAARRIQEACPTPIVVLTAHDAPEILERASQAGVGAFLTKPPEAAPLARALVIALARHRDLLRLAGLVADLERKTAELERALAEIRTLHGIIPMCMFCKKVRNDAGFWERVDHYIRAHTEAVVSHGLCPECFSREYGSEEQQR
jgi:two-component system, response regulator PdtaR